VERKIAGTFTGHVEPQLALEVFANAHPFVSARLDLLEVYDVVSGGSVAVLIEPELVAAQTLNRITHHARDTNGYLGRSRACQRLIAAQGRLLVARRGQGTRVTG